LRAAAGAITPSPLVSWALGVTRGTPVVERLAELGAGGGSAGLAGLLMKGGAVAVTASVLAGGIVTGHHHPKPTAKRTAAHGSRSAPTLLAVASVKPTRSVSTAGHGAFPPAQHSASHAPRFTRHAHDRRGRWLALPSPNPPSNIRPGRLHRGDGGNTHDSGSKDGGSFALHGDTSGGGGTRDGKDGGSSAPSGESLEGTSSSSTGEHGGELTGDLTGSGETGSGDSPSGSNDSQTSTESGGSTSTNELSKDEKTAITTEETVKHD
jgi:hypothetical protein